MAKRCGNHRIFLIYQEDINSKTCHSSVKLRESDTIYILTTNETPELAENFLDFFHNRQEFISLEKEQILNFLRERQTNQKECYYFIGPAMEAVYNEISQEVILFAKGVAKNETFGVSKVSLQIAKQGEINDLESQFGAIAEALAAASADTVKINADNLNKEYANERQQKKNMPMGEKTPSVKENCSSNQTETDCEFNLNLPEQKKTAHEIDIPAKCEHAKGKVILWILERFKEHVSIAITRDLEHDQCYNFLLLLLKADTAESFSDSWRCEEPNIQVKLSNDKFVELKSEAIYYYKLSKCFYEEDLWNY